MADYLVGDACVELKEIAKHDSVAAIGLRDAQQTNDATQLHHFGADVNTCLLAPQLCLGPRQRPAIIRITLPHTDSVLFHSITTKCISSKYSTASII